MSDVPEGTPFQMAVWAELLRIPRGEVRTYTQIAAAIVRGEDTGQIISGRGQCLRCQPRLTSRALPPCGAF